MKKLLSLLLSVLMCAALLPIVSLQAAQADDRYLEINETNFPDGNFRQWVIDNLPHEGDAATGYYMTKAQVDNVTEIVLTEDEDGPFYEIESVSGIEFFPALTHLDCSENFLTSLDVSRNTALTSLVCEFNELTSLDVSSNTALKQLLCGNNRLTVLDVSRNPALEWLDCGGNDDITELDVTKNPALRILECYGCKVKTLDLSKNTALLDLVSSGTELTTLDLSNNTNLQTFIHFGGELTALDLSSNPALEMVWCPENHISYLNAGHLMSLYDLEASQQTIPDQVGSYSDGQYYYDLSSIVPKEMLENVTIENATYHLNTTTGIVTFPSRVDSFAYDYDTGCVFYNDEPALMDVTVYLTFEVPSERYLEINETNFPDDNFRNYIINNHSVSGNASSGYYMTKAQVDSVKEVNCSNCGIQSLVGVAYFTKLTYLNCGYNKLDSLDISKNTELITLQCSYNQLTALNVSGNTALKQLNCGNNRLAALDVSKNTELEHLYCYNNQLMTLDVSANIALQGLACYFNQLTTLDISKNTVLWYLDCDCNQLTTLDVSNNPSLITLWCYNNKLAALDLSKNDMLDGSASNQNVGDQAADCRGGVYCFDMTKLMSKNQLKNVSFTDSSITMNGEGIVTLPWAVKSFTYLYDTSVDPYDGEIELPEIPTGNSAAGGKGYRIQMDVTVSLTYDGLPGFDGTIEWYRGDVLYNGKTPYVIANGQPQAPRFTVRAKDGSIVEPSHYTYEYRENINAGTAYLIVTFKDTYGGATRAWFKIYLPATDYTMVENRDDGIYMEWHAVEGAAGYVIYRRAWSSTTGGKWTDFVRWNNTTDLNWTDTKVYAGTRYQYGIKAYFAQRVDPVSGAMIGGNVGDNYNLGIVGPLKTTVRITTRTLNSVTGGSKRLTVKWSASKNFTGYEVQIATNAAFTKNVKTVKITDPKTSETTIKSLKAKTTYYARVRSYHVFEGTTYYGGWSNVKSAKTK